MNVATLTMYAKKDRALQGGMKLHGEYEEWNAINKNLDENEYLWLFCAVLRIRRDNIVVVNRGLLLFSVNNFACCEIMRLFRGDEVRCTVEDTPLPVGDQASG